MHYLLAEHEVLGHIHIYRQLDPLHDQMIVLLLLFDLCSIQHIDARGNNELALVVEEGIGPAAQAAVQIEGRMSGERRLRPLFINLDYLIDQIRD